MKKILLILFLLLIPIRVNASSVSFVVMDADSGRVLGGSNINAKMLIASTTKIMTAIVALENADLFAEYRAGEEIKKVYGSMIYIKEGETLTLNDLLYGLMLRSGNDAAMVIATNVREYDDFIDLMNKKAASLKMYNTTFENPHGLDDDTKNYSTAKDLAILMRYAMQSGEFTKITATKEYRCETNLTTHVWYNKNDLLINYKYATGGKIGYTTKSGHVFVSSASKDSKNLIVATLKDSDRFNTHEALYEAYFEKYEKYQILNRYTFFVNENEYKDYHLYIKNDFFMLLSENEKKDLQMQINLVKRTKESKESKAGYVNIKIKGTTVYQEDIFAIKNKTKVNKIKSMLFFWRK